MFVFNIIIISSAGRIGKYHQADEERKASAMTLGLKMSPINEKATKQLKEVSFVFPLETFANTSTSSPSSRHCGQTPSTHHLPTTVLHEEEDLAIQLLSSPRTQFQTILLPPQCTFPYSSPPPPPHSYLMTTEAVPVPTLPQDKSDDKDGCRL